MELTRQELWDIYVLLSYAKMDDKYEKCKIIKKKDCDNISKKIHEMIKKTPN